VSFYAKFEIPRDFKKRDTAQRDERTGVVLKAGFSEAQPRGVTFMGEGGTIRHVDWMQLDEDKRELVVYRLRVQFGLQSDAKIYAPMIEAGNKIKAYDIEVTHNITAQGNIVAHDISGHNVVADNLTAFYNITAENAQITSNISTSSLSATNANITNNLFASSISAVSVSANTVYANNLQLQTDMGTFTLPANSTSVNVSFSKTFSSAPKVVVTPQGQLSSWWVSNVTPTGFTFNVSIAPLVDVTVAYIALL